MNCDQVEAGKRRKIMGDRMYCDHGQRVWYIRGWNTLPSNRVGQNCVLCMIRHRLGNALRKYWARYPGVS